MLPNRFVSTSQSVTNYDWVDFAAGAGYVKFYLIGQCTSTGNAYTLSTEADDSDATNSGASSLGAGTTEYNFDYTILKPIIIYPANATAVFSMSASAGVNVYVKMTVMHVSLAAAETALGNTTSRTATNVDYTRVNMPIALTTKSFGIGEKIRVSVEVTSSGNFSSMGWGATGTNNCYVTIPFKIDL